ncbi:MAG: serine hydrolase domain-containing protein [Saprospiraceae bacterium]
MKMLRLTLLMSGCFVTSLLAQNNPFTAWKHFDEVVQHTTVLKNTSFLLPIKDLKTSVSLVSLDGTDLEPLKSSIGNYGYEASQDDLNADLVVAVVGENLLAGEAVLSFIKRKLPITSKLMVLLLNKPKEIQKHLSLLQGDVVLIAESPIEDALFYAGQVMYGGSRPTGTLSNDLTIFYRKGFGLNLPEPTRLGYAAPKSVGMDGEKLSRQIDSIVNFGLEEKAYPGAQVLVARKGQIVYHQTYGFHDYDSIRTVEREDLYDYASVTKVSASTPALVKLYGEGKFDPDQRLGNYVPFFKHSDKGDLVLRRMLAHQSGLLAWIPFWRATLKNNSNYPWKGKWDNAFDNDYRFKNRTLQRDSSQRYSVKITDDLWLHDGYLKKIYRSIRKSPLSKDPQYVYSDLTFHIMPLVIQEITGQRYEDYVKENIHLPIGATTTTYNPLRFFPKERMVPTERDTFFRMTQIQGTVHDEGAIMMGGISGNAGLFSKALDLAKLFQMYLNGGTYGGQRILQEESLAEFTKCQYCEEGNHRGMGFEKPLIEYDPNRSPVAASTSPLAFGHSGYTGTYVWVDPKEDLLFIFFSNRVHPTRNNRKLYQLNIRPSIHQVLYDTIID